MFSPWAETLFAKYGPIVLGLLFGTTAKYALTLAEGRRVTTRMLVIDALLVGMVAIVASNVVERLGAAGNAASLVAALFAVSSDRVIRLIRERFLQRVDAELRRDIEQQKGAVREAVQTELSGKSIIEDTLSGRAPTEYLALLPHPLPPSERGPANDDKS
jgi:hypothetical protein